MTHDLAIDPATRKALDAFLERVASRFPMREAILFGSRARGDARPDSDVDVAILLEGPQGSFLNTKLEMADIAFNTMLETGMRVQPLPIWDEQWRRPDTWLNPELLQNIARTGVRL